MAIETSTGFEPEPTMTNRKTDTSKKRPTAGRRRKKKTVNQANAAAVESPTDAGTPVRGATQVDVAEVTTEALAETDGGTGSTAKRTPRRRSRRTRKSVRQEEPSPAADSVVTTNEVAPPSVSAPAGKSAGRERVPPKAAGGRPSDAPTTDTAVETPLEPADADLKKRRRRGSGRVRKKRSRQREADSAQATPVQPTVEAPKSDAIPETKPSQPSEPTEALEKKSRPGAPKPQEKEARRKPTRRGRRSKVPSGERPEQPRAVKPETGEDDKGTVGPREATAEEDESDAPTGAAGEMEMLINVSAGDECRIAILDGGRLEELFIEREATQTHVGNIYKGRITNIEPSIQAVFVDFGVPQNGFLHVSDVQPQYFPNHVGAAEDVGRRIPRYNRPPIQKCFRRGQEVVVQVIKEGLGTKGPTLTTYLSIPGRFLVMMPGMSRHGVSRKIEDETDRRTMRDLLNQLDLPSDMGFILRTAGLGRSKRELQRDLQYLMRLWKTVADRIKNLPAPAELYQESDLVTRTIRDIYAADFKRVIVDDPDTARKARECLHIAMPRSKAAIELYTEREPLFHRYGIEEEIEKINMRKVPLPSGGSLVIDSTEALVAIDVNSGRSRSNDDAEEAALKVDLEAAEEIARQLRLRDLGGLIVCDFIDLRLDRNKRAVERTLREAVKKHKERTRILRMSAFGLIEMTRQRQGPSLKRNIYYDCLHCKGTGLVKMPDSVILDVMRIVQLATHNDQVQQVTVTAASDVAFRILNNKRAAINRIEAETGKKVIIRGDARFTSDQVDYACEDNRGRPVNMVSATAGGNLGR